jgi:hypothetical protein
MNFGILQSSNRVPPFPEFKKKGRSGLKKKQFLLMNNDEAAAEFL